MSFDGIRIARAGLLIGWIFVSMLVVAGFAAFSAGDEDDDSNAPAANVDAGLGRTVGAVSALSFVGSAETTSSTTGPTALDPSADRSKVLGRTSGGTDSTAPSDREGGVYIRSGYLAETEVRTLVSSFFRPDDVNRAIRVAWCESSFNPAAVNPASGASGLFQHLPEHWAERSEAAGRAGQSIFDPEANVAVAAWMLYELPGGWSHWDCSR